MSSCRALLATTARHPRVAGASRFCTTAPNRRARVATRRPGADLPSSPRDHLRSPGSEDRRRRGDPAVPAAGRLGGGWRHASSDTCRSPCIPEPRTVLGPCPPTTRRPWMAWAPVSGFVSCVLHDAPRDERKAARRSTQRPASDMHTGIRHPGAVGHERSVTALDGWCERPTERHDLSHPPQRFESRPWCIALPTLVGGWSVEGGALPQVQIGLLSAKPERAAFSRWRSATKGPHAARSKLAGLGMVTQRCA